MTFLGDERKRWRDLESGEHYHLRGRAGDVLAEEAQDVASMFELEKHRPAVDVLDRVEPELKRRNDAEVAAPAADRPEKVFVLLLASDHEFPVCRYHVGGYQVVAGESVPTRQVADATAKSEPADSCGRDDAARGGEAKGV